MEVSSDPPNLPASSRERGRRPPCRVQTEQ